MLVIENDNYYLTVGRDAESTIESINVNERVAEWIKDIESQDCQSITSCNLTNEEMLNYIYGHTKPRKSEIRRILSDTVLIYKASTENLSSNKTMTLFAEESGYTLEEVVFRTTVSQSDQVISSIEESKSILDNFRASSTHESSLGQKELGVYVDYHTAVTDIVTSNSGHDSALSQTEDFTSISTELPTDSDSVFTYSMSGQSSNDDNNVSSHHSACESYTYSLPNPGDDRPSTPCQVLPSTRSMHHTGCISHTILHHDDVAADGTIAVYN